MKQKTAIRQLIESLEFLQNKYSDAGLITAIGIAKKLEPVNEQQIKDFHIAVMKNGLINEGGLKWTDSYLPKITEVANQTFNETFEKP